MEVSRLPISASHIGKLISAGYTSIYSLSSLSPSDIARVGPVGGIGENWGTHATHPLELSTTVQLLKDNGFQKVKLFDADSTTLTALSGSGMEIMVGIPNEMLYSLANSVAAAEKWVEKNVSAHISSNSVNTRETNCFPS